jgi:hypothetical protein
VVVVVSGSRGSSGCYKYNGLEIVARFLVQGVNCVHVSAVSFAPLSQSPSKLTTATSQAHLKEAHIMALRAPLAIPRARSDRFVSRMDPDGCRAPSFLEARLWMRLSGGRFSIISQGEDVIWRCWSCKYELSARMLDRTIRFDSHARPNAIPRDYDIDFSAIFAVQTFCPLCRRPLGPFEFSWTFS